MPPQEVHERRGLQADTTSDLSPGGTIAAYRALEG
jgi:hypothetical protein